ncbi:MAG: RhtB family transporter [Alphaproteobacteria bacterium]|nr:MAG: RhtB family transporter [Alphaproteobacteria bacterium]
MTQILVLPDWSLLAPFLVAALALNLTPGVDMTYVLARSVSQGRPAGLLSALGIATGSLVHTLAAAIGLSALLLHSQAAFLAVKYAGAAYLLYLAWRALRDGHGAATAAAGRPAATLGRVYAEGVLINVMNPKVALFILAFLPQFVDPAKGQVAAQIVLLGTLFNIGGTAVNCAVAWAGSAAGRRLKASAGFDRALRWLSATVFAGLAIHLAVSERG